MSQPRSWIVAVVVAVAAIAPPAARAESKNEIRSVSYDEDAGTTRIRVRGAQTPTFTVYKLERPSRVVVDVPQAQLGESLRGHEAASVWSANTWAVSSIAAQQLDDGGQVVRVIVTLARPGRYDVKTEGNELVVIVMPRDAAPKQASPEALAAAQAEATQAKTAAAAAKTEATQAKSATAAAQAEAQQAKSAATAAQAEAERLRQAAAKANETAAAAQRAADDARRAGGATLSKAQADADRAKAQAAAAQAQAQQAKDAAAVAQRELAAAQQEVARSRTDAEATKVAAARDVETMKAAAARDVEAMKAAAARDVEAARQSVARAKAEVDAAKAEAEAAKQDAARIKAQALAAKQDAARTRSEADAARSAADKASAQARASQAEADAAKVAAQQREAETIAARRQIEVAQRDAAQKRAEADAARAEAAKMKDDNARVRGEADAAKAEAGRLRMLADAAKAEAVASKAQAAADKRQAEQDKRQAEAARGDAEAMLRDAKQQLASLDQKTQAAQALEDKARATSAAAQAREEAARSQLAQATTERQAAENAIKQAEAARDRAQQAGSARDQASTEASKKLRDAEQRLAAAREATAAAEQQRQAAEAAAKAARGELDKSRTMLASIEQQRTSAESAASDAARRRSEAEAAATDASRRRKAAETAAERATAQREAAEDAASEAKRRRGEAEQQRLVAEQDRQAAESAAKAAKVATEAAERQRKVAEAAAGTAIAAKRDAEVGLAELSERRTAAEKAAAALEARSKAEAKAQAELIAAEARKAGDATLAKARAETDRLAVERKRAEAELADRRKAVAAQQAEADRLRLAAAQARDAADREEARRAKLVAQRTADEQAATRKPPVTLVAANATPVVASPPPSPTAPAVRDNLLGSPDAKPTLGAKPFTPNGPPAIVRAIDFTGDDVTGHVDIAVNGDATVTVGQVSATAAELIIDHATIDGKLERKLDVSRFGGPVRAISSFRDRRTPNRVRLVAELTSPATPTFDRATGKVRWNFVGDNIVKRPVVTRAVQNVPSPVVSGFGAASTPVAQQSVSQLPPQGNRRRVYHGQTVELHFKDAPIHDLLRIIADTGKVSIIVPDTIDAKVTLDLKRVPWDQALEVILSSHQLWYRREGNLYRIAPRKELDAEDEAEAARREAALKAETPRAQLVPLNYASATDLVKKLEPMLSPHGKIAVDDRTNQIIVTDVAGNREQIARLATSLDTQTPQISIEARIVEARSTFVRQIGVQWGGRSLTGANSGNATGLIWPSTVNIIGGNTDTNTISTGVASPSDFAVNLPAATGAGEGGAIGLSLGSVGGNFNINLRLSALEDSGTVRIISAPKVTVLNNKLASIASGVSIPISTVSATGTQTQFVQADLKLDVTPTVSQSDCAISMNLVVMKNEADFVNVGARGDPTILRKEARTTMLVADGETSVLGGIYTRNSGIAYKKIPFFADIPVLGWLFKSRRENDDRTEILVFITPKITNRNLLNCKR